MKNKRENILVKGLKGIMGFVVELIAVVFMIFKVALKPNKKQPLKGRAICAAIAAVITGLVIVKLFCGSMIYTGIAYGSASIQKHLAVLWASDKGDWSHWMTGGRYLYFKEFKEDLIATDGFANFLSSLAGNGFLLKVVQIALIALCYISMFFLFSVLFKCVRNLVRSIRAIIRKKNKKRARAKESEQIDRSKIIRMSSYQPRTPNRPKTINRHTRIS